MTLWLLAVIPARALGHQLADHTGAGVGLSGARRDLHGLQPGLHGGRGGQEQMLQPGR